MTKISRINSQDILIEKQGVETIASPDKSSVFGNPAAGNSSNEIIDAEKLSQGNSTQKLTFKERFKDFHIDLSSEEYRKLTPKEKSKYIVNEFGKFLYEGTPPWEQLSDKQKERFFNQKLVNHIEKTNPEMLEGLNKRDIAEYREHILTTFEVALSRADGETDLKQVLDKFFKAGRKERAQAEYEYVKQLAESGQELLGHQKHVLQKGDFEAAAKKYQAENDIKDIRESEFSYLQSKLDAKEELTAYEQRTYDILKRVKDNNNGKLVSDGSKPSFSLEETLNQFGYNDLIKDSNGQVDWENPKNIKVLKEFFNNRIIKAGSTQESRDRYAKDLLGNLDIEGQLLLSRLLTSDRSKVLGLNKEDRNHYLDVLLKNNVGMAQVAATEAIEAGDFEDSTLQIIGSASNSHIEKLVEDGNTDGADAMVVASGNMVRSAKDRNVKADITTGLAETNYAEAVKESAALTNEQGIADLVDKNINESPKITADNQSLYAQASVETLNDDDAKVTRTEELNKFGNAYFTKGTVLALGSYETDAARNEADKIITETVENKLDAEGRKLVTQTRMDVMSQFSADLQKQMYERTMQSRHDDVLEIGAQNIYQLDESIRDYAVDITKALGKDNVTNSIRTEAPVVNNTGAASADVSSVQNARQFVDSNLIGNRNNLSDNAKKVYDMLDLANKQNKVLSKGEFFKMFNNLTDHEKINLLKSLPSKLISSLPVKICEKFPDLIPTMVNLGRGIEILKSCSSHTFRITVNCMKGSDNTKKQLNSFIAENPAFFTRVSQEAAKAALGDADSKNLKSLKLNG